jgi:peptidoglycan/LPS O-acetylase OafA/YrhL
MERFPRGRIPELDGLRGIAIAMVLACHYLPIEVATRHGSLVAYLKVLLGFGWSGVDLFFVLSGFLIGGILIDARESENFFGVFYTRRFFRIVPIYSVILLLFPLADFAVRSIRPGGFYWLFANPMPWFSYATFTQNFWMAFHNSEGGNFLAPTWSLAIEEQFYLTLPLLIRLLPRRKLMTWLPVIICCVPVLRTVLLLHWRPNVMAELTLTPCRADALLMGVLAAAVVRDDEWRERISRHSRHFRGLLIALLAGVALLVRTAPGISFPPMRSFGFTWLALFYVGVLLFAVTQRESWLSRRLRNRWLMWLGSIAYGLYLIHQPVQGLIYGFFGGRAPVIQQWNDVKFALISLVVTIFIARVSWLYFERPLVEVGHRWHYRPARPVAGEEGEVAFAGANSVSS